MPPEAAAGRRERNKAANRRAILDAARDCFLEQGFEATTIRDVIRRTGLASGTFYNYFRDKHELLHALIAERMDQLTAELVAVRRRAASLREFVHGAYLAAFRAVQSDPVLHELMLRNHAAIARIYETTPLGVSLAALRADIEDAPARGLMPPVDAELLAAAFYGAGYEISRLLAAGTTRDADTAAEFATALFLDGLNGITASRSRTPPPPRVR